MRSPHRPLSSSLVATRFCSVCGAVLRNGACPQGHPQRAARGKDRRPRRARGRGLVTLVVVLALLGAAAYAGLVWYPERAARDLVGEASPEWNEAYTAYQAAVDALPGGEGDVEESVGAAEEILRLAEEARITLVEAQTRLDADEPAPIPVISDRPPLGLAVETREDMLTFYVSALEVVTAVQDVGGYLADVAQTLPELDNLERALANLRGEGGVEAAVESAEPIAEQLVADVESIDAPDELSNAHATLLAIARQIRAAIGEAAAASGPASGLIGTLLGDVGEEVAAFRNTLAEAPLAARQSGMGTRLADLRRLADRINSSLRELDDAGVPGVEIPR